MASERMHRPMMPRNFLRNRKRATLAAGLVAVMSIMWGRVLLGHKPPAAAATEKPAATQPTAARKASAQVTYLELPVVPGRHDTIARDFFTGRDWNGFSKNAGVKTGTDTEGVRANTDRTSDVEKMAKKLNLQAVVPTGERPEALINDQLVHVGDTFPFQEGAALYVFEVKQIGEDSVLVECSGQTATLKMK